jgi:hypothetical protein
VGPELAEKREDDGIERTFGLEARIELCELLLRGEAVVPEEEADLFEGGLLGEFIDVVAGVDELAFLAINAAELGSSDVNSFETASDVGHLAHSNWGGCIQRGILRKQFGAS